MTNHVVRRTITVAFMAIITLDSFNSYSFERIQRRQRIPGPISAHRHYAPVSSLLLHLKDDRKPDYENIHGPLGETIDDIFLSQFRSKMAEKFGFDSKLPKNDYQGLMELAIALNSRYSNKREMQYLAQEVLRSLFPSWLPRSFAWLFAKPFPEFSSRLNAWATYVAGTWLMGECVINDYEIDGGGIAHGQGLLVKRCRFLEESGCASICINACKIPTQNFFNHDMGLPLTMTPDYDTGECQFSFGRSPTVEEELKAKRTPCLSRCPSSSVRSIDDPTDASICNEMN